MSRNVTIIIAGICLISMLAAGSAMADKRGTFGAGIGTVSGVGSPVFDSNTNAQLLSIHAFGMLGLTPWFAGIADFTVGLPKQYEGVINGGEQQSVDVSAFFFDAMGGVYKTYSEGGYLYLGAGFTIATGNREDTVTDAGGTTLFKSEPGTNLGLVFGAGFGLPIKNDMFGFISVRQRFVTAEVETTDPNSIVSRQDVSLGGLEVAAGMAFGFGI